jgi:formylglycine-generating enzyme required for sulfatase activity
LSKKAGKVFRLPSEAEWEYAVRGGTTTIFWWGDEWQKEMGVCRECGTKWDNRQTAPVGAFKPNPYGLYDMTGNVYEWCLDYKHENYVNAPLTGAIRKDGQQDMRVLRGGSLSESADEFVSYARCWDFVHFKDTSTGFRVTMEP